MAGAMSDDTMLKKLLPCAQGVRLPMALTPLFIVGEVLMEILIPLVMAQIVNVGLAGEGDLAYIWRMGALMVALACLSLLFGGFLPKFRNSLLPSWTNSVRPR